MSDPLGVAIVGSGIMARTHASILAGYHRSRVTGWVSRGATHEELAAVAEAPVHRDLAAALTDPATGAVLVATPDHLHRDAAVAAAEAGRHVLVEKPLATTVEDAEAIRDAARANGVTVMTLFNHRFVPAYWQAKQQIASGDLGDVRLAYARKNDTRYVPEQMISWAHRTTPSWFLSSHDIDLLLWYAEQEVVSVHAAAVHGVLTGAGIDTPDAVQAQLVLANGAVATVEACWIYPDTFPTMTDSFLEVVLSDGLIHLDRKKEAIEVASRTAYSFPRTQLAGTIAGKPAGSTAAAVGHFVDCALDGTAPLVDLESSVHVTRVLAAITTSCATGRTVHLEETPS